MHVGCHYPEYTAHVERGPQAPAANLLSLDHTRAMPALQAAMAFACDASSAQTAWTWASGASLLAARESVRATLRAPTAARTRIGGKLGKSG